MQILLENTLWPAARRNDHQGRGRAEVQAPDGGRAPRVALRKGAIAAIEALVRKAKISE